MENFPFTQVSVLTVALKMIGLSGIKKYMPELGDSIYIVIDGMLSSTKKLSIFFFLISSSKYLFWVLIRSALLRHFS